MEPGTHYLAKLELIIMFHGALRKFRSIGRTSAKGDKGEGEEGTCVFEKRVFHERACRLENMQYLSTAFL